MLAYKPFLTLNYILTLLLNYICIILITGAYNLKFIKLVSIIFIVVSTLLIISKKTKFIYLTFFSLKDLKLNLMYTLLFIPGIIYFLRIITFNEINILSSLDHDNVYHYYILRFYELGNITTLPYELSLVPHDLHKIFGSLLSWNNGTIYKELINYIIFQFTGIALFILSTVHFFNMLCAQNKIKNTRKILFGLFPLFFLQTGFLSWMIYTGAIPFIYSISFLIFGFTVIHCKPILSKYQLLAYIYFSASIIVWPAISIPIIIFLSLFYYDKRKEIISKMNLDNLKEKINIVLSLIIFIFIFFTQIIKNERLNSNIPPFSSPGPGGLGEVDYYIICLFLIYVAITNKKLNKYLLIVLLSILSSSIFVDHLIGTIFSSYNRYYSSKINFILIPFLTLLILGIIIQNIERNMRVKKMLIPILSSFLLSNLIIFPYFVPDYVPYQNKWNRTISLSPGLLQLSNLFIKGDYINPIISASSQIKAYKWQQSCKVEKNVLYIPYDQRLNRSGSAYYSALWFASLTTNPFQWNMASKFRNDLYLNEKDDKGRLKLNKKNKSAKSIQLVDLNTSGSFNCKMI
jgi:hypothetical protein